MMLGHFFLVSDPCHIRKKFMSMVLILKTLKDNESFLKFP